MFLALKASYSRFAESMTVRRWAALILAEVLIVVLGVYVAAWLGNAYQEGQRRERFELLVEALGQEVEPFLEQSGQAIELVREQFDEWGAQYDAGRRPLPFHLPATGTLTRPHSSLWDAILDSGGLELLPVELITLIADFYERNDRLIERYYSVNSFAQQHVLPYLDAGLAHFYVDDGERLRPMYAIHMQEWEATIAYAEETLALGQAIRSSELFED